MKIPFLDLKAEYAAIRGEIGVAVNQVLESTAFAGGPFVESFEREFAAFCQCHYAVGVGSGTEAIWLSLLAVGVGSGHEVITVPNTFMATAEAISLCGAKPVLVDIDPATYNMNPALLERAITARTKAIIPVHLFGQPADMDPILDIAKRHGLFVVEDACQAHGAEYKGRRAGSLADAGCYSFYPSKNLGAYGEAGAVVTNNPDLARKIRVLRDHGQTRKYLHAFIGWNARMDGLQGAILSVKLRHLPAWNDARRRHATVYAELLGDLEELTLPYEAPYAKHVYHIYAIRLRHRDELMKVLSDHHIICGIHYPLPIHLQEPYRPLCRPNRTFPVAEASANQLLSLPMFPDLTRGQLEYVAHAIRHFIRHPQISTT